jgi:hypothetical protein
MSQALRMRVRELLGEKISIAALTKRHSKK